MTKKLTVRLPEGYLVFVKRYAKEQGITVNALFDDQLGGLTAVTAVTASVTESIGRWFVVSGNVRDFKDSSAQSITPSEFLVIKA